VKGGPGGTLREKLPPPWWTLGRWRLRRTGLTRATPSRMMHGSVEGIVLDRFSHAKGQ
jgi:hypothetical protein